MVLPISTSVDLSKLRALLMILTSFLLFFSVIPVFETGLNRYNLIIGAFIFFFSSICFWFCSSGYDYLNSGEHQRGTASEKKLEVNIVHGLFIIWIILLVLSVYFIIISIPK